MIVDEIMQSDVDAPAVPVMHQQAILPSPFPSKQSSSKSSGFETITLVTKFEWKLELLAVL